MISPCVYSTHTKTPFSSYQCDVMGQGLCEWNSSSKTLYSDTHTHLTLAAISSPSPPCSCSRGSSQQPQHPPLVILYDAGHKHRRTGTCRISNNDLSPFHFQFTSGRCRYMHIMEALRWTSCNDEVLRWFVQEKFIWKSEEKGAQSLSINTSATG